MLHELIMVNYFVVCVISALSCSLNCSAIRTGSRHVEVSSFSYHENAWDLDTGCLHKLTINNTVTDFTFKPHKERSFLLDLYYATGGPHHWLNSTGWRDNSSLHHCQWYGIECYPNSSYIKWISLEKHGLVGRPPNFWRFRNLQGICLAANNEMNGTLADLISGNMTRLRRMHLSFTGLYGPVPWKLLLQLHNLEKLQICCMVHGSKKKLYGNITQDIGRLNKLQVLSLGENDIQGYLPPSIANLTKLWFLDLEYIKLKSGELSYLSHMRKLQVLHLSHCGLRTTLPSDFGQKHPDMIELLLNGNKIQGELDDECFRGMEKITQLSLASNNLHGLIPASLNQLKSLQVLDLSKNNFTDFAENMTFNAQLQMLFIGGNVNLKLDVKLFAKALLPCKDNLRMLIAKNCGLNGELSVVYSIWMFRQIMYVDLSYNNMTGLIPLSGPQNSIPYLFYLNLAFNNFSGELPISFFTPLKSLTFLDIRGNRHMKSKSTFLSLYLNVTRDETLRTKTFTCPTLRLKNSGGRAEIDPEYYDYSLCFCNRGYYGYSKYCERCMEGASCEVELSQLTKATEIKLKDPIKVEMIIGKGYWPCCGDFNSVTRMVKCSQQEKFDDKICSPSGDCKCELKLVNGELKTICNTSCICRYGNKGRLCSQCIDGYYKKGSLCISCPAFRENFPGVIIASFVVCLILSVALLISLRYRRKLVLVLMFVFAVALVVLHVTSIIPGWFFVIIFAVWILGLSGAGKNLGGFLCITVFFFQSLDAMFSDANVWPTIIVLLKYQITNVFNFGISELTCSSSHAKRPEVGFAFILLLPLTGILLLWLFYGFVSLGKLFPGCQNINISNSSCKRLSIQILLFMYFPIAAKTFRAVSPCEHRDGLSYLKDTPWLDCEGTSYNWLRALGFVSLLVFVIGIPFFVFIPLLYKYVNNEGQAVFEGADMWLEPLYESYKTEYRRYFPIVFLFRRLLLAVFLTIVPTTSSYQVVGITLLLLIYITITLVFRPYQPYSERFEFETMTDVTVSIVLLLSFVGLALLRVSPKFDNSLVWLIISQNLVVVVSCLISIFVSFVVNLWKSSNVVVEVQLEGVQYEQIPGEQNERRPIAYRQW